MDNTKQTNTIDHNHDIESSIQQQEQQQKQEKSLNEISSPKGTAKRRTKTSEKKRSSDTTSSGRSSRSKSKSKPSFDITHAMKHISLFLLVAQMVGLVLLLRYSRSKHGADLYLASTAVFLMEVMKFIICLSVVFVQSNYNVSEFLKELDQNVTQAPFELVKLSVPSFLYTIQNNLLYFALTNLDAATYQICYQLKILTTALFSAVMLKRQFSSFKWLSLFILTIGVATVQSATSSSSSPTSAEAEESKNRFIGFIAVVCAACTSGFSGVYFERILKSSIKTSLWIRNIQMGLPSMVVASLTVLVHDYATVSTKGFFVGYSFTVWMVIIIQAVGGLIVAVVVKYADNVLKGFATSFSIIISCFVSALFFHDDFHPSFQFFVGTGLVLTASVMYSRPEKKQGKKMADVKKTSSSLPVSSANLGTTSSKTVLTGRSSSVIL